MTSMMNKPTTLFLFVLIALLTSCADHDDPKLAPIDTTQVKITADISDSPNSAWMNVTEEMTVRVSDIKMNAPKGVVLKSIALTASSGYVKYTLDDKPYSGDPLEFKIPLTGMRGRLNFALIGNLIKKDSRDAEILIADNIQKIVFSESPEFECEGQLYVSVKSKSTTGEEYNQSFEVRSVDHLKIPVPKDKLYWTPTSGTASTIDISLGAGGTAWSPNTTFDCKITKSAIGNPSGDDATLKLTIPNSPGSLNAQKLQEYIISSYYGTWEDISIEPYNLTNVFDIVEE